VVKLLGRLLFFPLVLCSCLQEGGVDITSESDFSSKGLRILTESVYEGGITPVTVSLNYTTPRDVTFRVRTVGVSAQQSTDFHPVNKLLTIPAGQREVEFPVTTFINPRRVDDRVLSIEVSDVDGADILSSSATLTITRPRPRATVKNVSHVASGYRHICSLQTNGLVYCWGGNVRGQLGSGTSTTADSNTRSLVPGLSSGPVKLVSNYETTCALYANGAAYCWGDNTYKQINPYGETGVSIETAKSFLAPGDAVVDIAVGPFMTCGLWADGQIKCKGYNGWGQAGLNHGTTPQTTLSPALNIGGSDPGAVSLALSESSICAVLTTGAVKCWGKNSYGELGTTSLPQDGSIYYSPWNTDISSGALSVAAGDDHMCALMTGGGVKCWGRNHYGQTGRGTMTAGESAPADVALPAPAVELALNNDTSCARLTNGEVYCWGWNEFAQLGDTTLTSRSSPVKALNLPLPVTQLSVGRYHACATLSDKSLRCWGGNGFGQSSGGRHNLLYPMDLDVFIGVKVADLVYSPSFDGAGDNSLCVITPAGQGYCYGDNTYRQIGRNIATSPLGPDQPLDFGSSLVNMLSAGFGFACALLDTTGVKCWGRNNFLQMGTGISGAWNDPPVTPNLLGSGVAKLSSQYNYSCAVMNDKTLRCWGALNNGFCGYAGTPTAITGAVNVAEVAIGYYHACYVDTAGAVKCWGTNTSGVLGNGVSSTSCQVAPVAALLSEPVAKLSLGHSHTCALLQNGSVKCWGDNTYKQTGQTSGTSVKTPNLVPGLKEAVKDISTGYRHTCALTTGGAVKCWGFNLFSGSLGVNSYQMFSTAVPQDALGLSMHVKKLKGGPWLTCAITEDDFIKCWGHSGDISISGWLLRVPTEVEEVLVEEE
jgi:alpha-tubulin suppressor-like RCC1 family protein